MKRFLFLFLVLLTLSGCASDAPTRREHFAMDTVITLQAYGPRAEAAIDATLAEIDRLDKLFSIGNPDSEIAQLNSGKDVSLSSDTRLLLASALELSAATGGAYDCSIQPLVECWGWYTDSPAIPSDSAIQDALRRIGHSRLRLTDDQLLFDGEGMGIDLGGIAKGYAAGIAADILRAQGITSALLDLGGNIHALGRKSDGSDWIIGIDDPSGRSAYLGTVPVRDCAVVTSGSSQRWFEQDGIRFHHILDPNTGRPADSGLAQVTIVCPDDTLADGLSTALFVMGIDEAISFWRSYVYEFEFVLVADTGEIFVSDGLEFTSNLPYEVIH